MMRICEVQLEAMRMALSFKMLFNLDFVFFLIKSNKHSGWQSDEGNCVKRRIPRRQT